LPSHWKELTKIIKNNYDIFDAFIITHGTNTLGYTSAALSFSFPNLNKPIILTGSQTPFGLPGSDALNNLTNAIRIAVLPRERNRVKGVFVVFGSHIITGSRVKKMTEFDYDGFVSFQTSSIGRIGRIININESNLEKHLSYLSTAFYTEAKYSKHLICEDDFDMRIASITEFPGISPNIFECLVENNDIKGFILRSFGAGDSSSHLRPAFDFLKSREIPIVITTQAPNGNASLQINEPGYYLWSNDLAIPAFDMCMEAQTTKLAWLLAKRANGILNYSNIKKEMIRDIRGEINVFWESTY